MRVQPASETIMGQRHLEQDVEHIVPALVHALGDQLLALVLYGSMARGEAKEGSDIDLYVIVEDRAPLPEHPIDRAQWLYDRLPPGSRGDVSLHTDTRSEFESGFPSLYLDLGLDGRILWEREGYATAKLARIRELIDAAGLFRVRLSPTSFFWDWKRPPVPGRWRVDWTGVYGLPR